MSELTRRIRRKLGEYRPRATIQPARMGLDDGTVEVDGEKYMIWVKLFDGQTLKAINQRVTNKFGKLVQVGYDEVQFPSRLQVLGTWDVYDEPQWAGTPNHADQHAWLGDDPIFLRQEQFTPGLVLPVSGSVSVDVYPFSSFTGGSWYTQTEITRVDVSSGLPTSEGYRYALLVLKSDQTFGLRLGSVAVSRMELTLDLIPVPTSGDTPLAALALYYGQSELVKEDQNNDIVDLRFLDAVVTESDYVRKDGTVAFTGTVAGVDPTSAAHLATKNYVDTNALLTVKEIDETPSVTGVTEIRVTNGTLTDIGSGVVELDFGSAATDGSAIHDNVAAEISGIAEKTSLNGDDLLVIEDSVDSWAKKRAKVSALGGGTAYTLVVNETFNDLSAWTQVRGSWSVSGNVLSKTNTGYADLRWNTDYYTITNSVLEVEVRFPSDAASIFCGGFVTAWDGSTLTGSMGARLTRNSTGNVWTCNVEKIGVADWGTAALGSSPGFSIGTWYKLRADFTSLLIPAWVDGVKKVVGNPFKNTATQNAMYVGLRVGDASAPPLDFRNFKVWIKNDYP